jgi:poly-beta-hydroxybutyrate-responsive repressor
MAEEPVLPRVFLRPLLLLALKTGETHGYDLTERLWTLGLATVDLAGVYRLLRTLEHERLVESWWEPSDNGPKRRVYRLNSAGMAEADRAVERLAGVHELLGQAIALGNGSARGARSV